MSDEIEELVRRHFEEIFNRGNLDACEETVAEHYFEHGVAPFGREEPGAVHGPTHMRGVAEWLRAQFPDLTMTIEQIVADGETVAALVRSEGTNLGPLSGMIPPTGRRFSARQSHWFRVEDGKLAVHWATRDDLTTMIQLGVIQPPGPPA